MKSRMALRVAVLCIATLPLASCVTMRQVTTKIIDGRVSFTSEEPRKLCLEDFSVYSDKQLIWAIERIDKSQCNGKIDFLIIYGIAPHGFFTTVEAEPLTAGFYVVHGRDYLSRDFYGGGFELSADRQSVQSYTSYSDKMHEAMSRITND